MRNYLTDLCRLCKLVVVRGCAQPLSAERAGAVNAKDNPPATDDGATGDLTDRQPPLPRVHVIGGALLVELLHRAHAGENPDLLYIEAYVNADRDEIRGAGA